MSGAPAPRAPGIGLDLVEIGRLERAIARRPRLAERLFRPGEIEFARRRRRPARHLAARFAAKEAAIKALGGACAPREVEVAGGGDRSPRLVLHGAARRLAEEQGAAVSVSLTHTDTTAAAVVLAAPVVS